MKGHYSIDLSPGDEGWFRARCNCGWEAPGVYPDAEDACDALMNHAYEAGRLAQAGAEDPAKPSRETEL